MSAGKLGAAQDSLPAAATSAPGEQQAWPARFAAPSPGLGAPELQEAGYLGPEAGVMKDPTQDRW